MTLQLSVPALFGLEKIGRKENVEKWYQNHVIEYTSYKVYSKSLITHAPSQLCTETVSWQIFEQQLKTEEDFLEPHIDTV